MAVFLIGGEKGGTGKTTLATNLSVWLSNKGMDTLVIDADPQGSATDWHNWRESKTELSKVHCVQKTNDIAASVRDLSKRYEQIIIDAGGRDSNELRSAMLVAEKMLIPVRASQFDLWTVKRMDELVSLAKGFNETLAAFLVISQAPTNPMVKEKEEAQEMLSDFANLGLCENIICERKAYRDAVINGMGVMEIESKAKDEMNLLAAEVYHGVF